MRLKLGKHHNAVTNWSRMLNDVRQDHPPVVKILDVHEGYAHDVKKDSPETLLIIRDAHNVDVMASPLSAAYEKLSRLKARADWRYADACEGNNEPDTYHWETFVAYAIFERRLAELLHDEGKKYVALSWGVGHPPLYGENPNFPWSNFLHHYRKVFEVADYLGLHEYGYPGMHSPGMERYHVLRFPHWYDRLPDELKKPIIITECGITHAVVGGPDVGWQKHLNAEQYAGNLIWYGEKLNDRPEVIAYLPFCDGSNDKRWESFFETQRVRDIVREYQKQTPEPCPPPGETYVVEDGISKMQLLWSQYPLRHLALVKTIIVHHTVTSVDTLYSQLGMYTFLVYEDGRVVQVAPLDRVAPHAGDPELIGDENRWSVGIAMVGDITVGEPSEIARRHLRRLVTDLIRGLPWFQRLIGHRELRPPEMSSHTQCPGGVWWEKWRGDYWAGIVK